MKKKTTRKASKSTKKKTAKTNGKAKTPRTSKAREAQILYGLDPEAPKCLHGCGKEVSKLFLQGHDAKLKGELIATYRGDEGAQPRSAYSKHQKAWGDTQKNVKAAQAG